MSNINHQRIDYIDSIRGIAAILVLIFHVICSHWDWMLIGKIGKIFFNGTGAVAMFFVLSGLVLSLKLIRHNTEITSDYMSKYLIKRILRIYPAFLFMLLFYIYFGYEKTSIAQIFEEALLIRGTHILFLPDWTLGVEMALSLFVPFMVIIIRKSRDLFIWFLIMTVILGQSFISEFIPLFGLGVLTAYHFNDIEQFDTSQHWLLKYKNYLAPLLIFLFSYHYIVALIPLPATLDYILTKIIGFKAYAFAGLGSFLILIFAINSQRLKNILSHKLLVFFGEISYGIYLAHWLFTTIVITNFEYFHDHLAGGNKAVFFAIYLTITFIGSVLLGWFIYRFVEIPFIKLSKKLITNLNQRG